MSISEDEQQIVDSLLRFVDQEIMPIQKRLGQTFENPRLYYREDGRESDAVKDARRAARMASAEAGFYTMFCPEELGGANQGIRLYLLCWEALFHRYGPPSNQLPYFVLSSFASGPHEVWMHASESLREEILPDLSSGRIHGGFGLTEPDAGSDSWMMKTTATRDGSDWIINGMKQWTSWSPTADFIIVYAVTDKEQVAARKGGITCFYVPTSTPGYKLESVLKIWGQIGGDEGILSFTDVRVPDRFRIGEEGKGLQLAMSGVRHGRLNHVGRSLGLARWALEKSIDYAKLRKTFARPIAEHQTIQNYIAECATKLYAMRCMALDCATKSDEGLDVRGEVSLAKLYCTNAAYEIVDTCIQIHGGMGVANETRLCEALFSTRLMRVAEGTTEIQLRTAAQLILSGRLDLSFS